MADITRLTATLCIVCAVAGLAIAFTYRQTAEKIAFQETLVEQQALSMAFPENTRIKKQAASGNLPDAYWIGEKEGAIIGYAFKGSAKGYSSDIKFIMGIDPQGTILGLTILSQEETPGLGTRVEETVSKKYLWNGLFGTREKNLPWFTDQFTGLKVTADIFIDKSYEWHTLNDENRKKLKNTNAITAITGATITTEAVSRGIKRYAYTYLSAIQRRNGSLDDTGNVLNVKTEHDRL